MRHLEARCRPARRVRRSWSMRARRRSSPRSRRTRRRRRHPRADPVGDRLRERGHRRIEHLEPERLGAGRLVGGRLAEQHALGASRPCGQRGEETDSPAAEDRGRLAELDGGTPDGMHADRKRLDQDTLVPGNALRNGQHVCRREDEVLGEPARHLAADEAHVGAKLWAPGAAVEACAATDREGRRRRRAGLAARTAFAELLDGPIDLVTDQERGAQKGMRTRPTSSGRSRTRRRHGRGHGPLPRWQSARGRSMRTASAPRASRIGRLPSAPLRQDGRESARPLKPTVVYSRGKEIFSRLRISIAPTSAPCSAGRRARRSAAPACELGFGPLRRRRTGRRRQRGGRPRGSAPFGPAFDARPRRASLDVDVPAAQRSLLPLGDRGAERVPRARYP